jgi:hypothetical protein
MKYIILALMFSMLSCSEDEQKTKELTQCEKSERKLDSIQNLYKTKFPVQGYDNPYYNPMQVIQTEYKKYGCNNGTRIMY